MSGNNLFKKNVLPEQYNELRDPNDRKQRNLYFTSLVHIRHEGWETVIRS